MKQEQQKEEKGPDIVFVISNNGSPLIPASHYSAYRLLNKKKAKVINSSPFTIKLNYDPVVENKKEVVLGIDMGYENVGFSVVTKNGADDKTLYCGELKLLYGVSKRLEERAMCRRNRRKRLRYRKNKNDRKVDKGWIAPSIEHKLYSHVRFIQKLLKLIPITKVIIETGSFDMQKMINPNISGIQYQQGVQYGYENVKAYVLARDNHTCQNPNCTHKKENIELHVHHIKYRSQGGSDAPSNLITLCCKCHSGPNHESGFLYVWSQNPPKQKSYKASAFMNIVRNRVVDAVKKIFSNVKETYGYITKAVRVANKIDKTHYNDAFVIAGGIKPDKCKPVFYKQVRRNNRSLSRFIDARFVDRRSGEIVSGSELNCGRTTRNKDNNTENLRKYRGERKRKGYFAVREVRYKFQAGDLVKYRGKVYEVKTSRFIERKKKNSYISVELIDNKNIFIKDVELKIFKYNKSFCIIKGI